MLGPVDLLVSVSARRSDGYLLNSRGNHIDWETRSAFANVGHEGRRHDVRIYVSFFGGEGTDEEFDRDLDRYSQDLILTWELDPTREARTSLQMYHSGLKQTLAWHERPPSEYRQRSVGGFLTQTLRLGGAHAVLLGVEGRNQAADVQDAASRVDRDVTTGRFSSKTRCAPRIEWVFCLESAQTRGRRWSSISHTGLV